MAVNVIYDDVQPVQGMANRVPDGRTPNQNASDESVPGAYSEDLAPPLGESLPVAADEPAVDLLQRYMRDVGVRVVLDAGEERELVLCYRSGDLAARNRMLVSNLRLVVSIARRYQWRGLPLVDLINEGNLGLMHALEKFDPERGFRFSTYATWWIRQHVEQALMEQSRTVRLPTHIVKSIHVVLRAREHLLSMGEGAVTDAMIAELIDLPLAEVQQLLRLNDGCLSLDVPSLMNADISLGDLLVDETGTLPEELVGRQETQAIVAEWLGGLTPRQRWIIERRYGFNGEDMLTLEEMALLLDISRERVRQIQTEALQQFRRHLYRRRLGKEDFL